MKFSTVIIRISSENKEPRSILVSWQNQWQKWKAKPKWRQKFSKIFDRQMSSKELTAARHAFFLNWVVGRSLWDLKIAGDSTAVARLLKKTAVPHEFREGLAQMAKKTTSAKLPRRSCCLPWSLRTCRWSSCYWRSIAVLKLQNK